MQTLQIGAQFPDMQAHVTDEREIRLPDEVHGHESVLLFYRGHW